MNRTMQETVQQLSHEAFPKLLREIPDRPEALYLRGTLRSEKNLYLAVVGSRRYSPYGREAAESLIAGLAGYPIVIVSGLALGIDAIAHRAALAAHLATIAVPGSGLSEQVLYPATHRALARDILDSGGALLSPFPPDFQATPYSFPERNRVMAGMSHATLIIEAAERSGSLITARLALDYNREVLTVPASIFSENARGTNMLLRLGATPILESAHILEALGIAPETSTTLDSGIFSPDEQRLLELLTHPLSRDEVIERLKLPARDANVILATLEMRGVITETLGEIRRKG